jgi:8-oxo-dGTP pyrophosphatase MutT (NUDIX family)
MSAAWASVRECRPKQRRASGRLLLVSWRSPSHIRALVIGVIWRGDELLVYEGRDSSKNETFYRPLGGGIDFGEAAVDALAREFREEIGTELEGVRYLETIENIYVFEGHPGHELVRVYEARLATPSLYERDSWNFKLEDGSRCHVLWKRLDDFAEAPLYPDGLLALLRRG